MTLAGCRVGSCGRGRPCVAICSNESWRRPGCGGPLRPAAIYAGPTVGSPQRGRGAMIPSNRAVVSVPSPQRGADYATAVGWRTQNNGYEYSAPRGCISHLGHAGQDPVLMVLISRTFSEVWNRCRALAYISPLASTSGTLHNVHSRDTDTTSPAPAFTWAMTPAATAALMM